MPVKSILQSRDLTWSIAFRGTVTVADLHGAIASTLATTVGSSVVFDFADATAFAMTSAQLYALAEDLRTAAGLTSKSKLAWAAATDLGYGIGREFETFVQSAAVPLVVTVFRKVPDAEQWLAATPACRDEA